MMRIYHNSNKMSTYYVQLIAAFRCYQSFVVHPPFTCLGFGQVSFMFPAAPPPGIAVLTASSTLPRRSAPEQGTRPDTAHRSTRLRLLDRRTAPVSTAIRRNDGKKNGGKS